MGERLVLGAGGMVGSAIVRVLHRLGHQGTLAPKRQELELRDQSAVIAYFAEARPRFVFMAAAKVGGIQANNTYRSDFIHENILIQANVFEAALRSGTERLLFLGSSCIYPKKCPQPIREDALLTGPLEPTNEPYAIAKISGLKTAENIRRQFGKTFFSVMPTNLYGEGDNYHPQNSHVIPGLIQRMHDTMINGGEQFEIWGTGRPRREFLHVDDLAEACVFLMDMPESRLPYWINVGTGNDVSIEELARLIGRLMGYSGGYRFNEKYPDGTLRKRLDVDLIQRLGWKARIDLESGLKRTIEAYLRNPRGQRRV